MFEDLKTPAPHSSEAADSQQPGLPFPGWPPEPTQPFPATPIEPPLETRDDSLVQEAEVTEPGQISARAAESDLADWKAELRRDFEKWLDGLDHISELEDVSGDVTEVPDLSSFYQQLAMANTEARKANRRTAEAFKQWGDTLSQFESQLAPLRETAAQLAAVQVGKDNLPRAYCLVLVELLDRMRRLAQAFASPPPAKSWWGSRNAAWHAAWEKQRHAMDILLSHLEQFLKKEGVTRLEVLGQAFDPTVMIAVAAEPDTESSPQTVLEEVAPGYRHRGELLRPAQVKVSVEP